MWPGWVYKVLQARVLRVRNTERTQKGSGVPLLDRVFLKATQQKHYR